MVIRVVEDTTFDEVGLLFLVTLELFVGHELLVWQLLGGPGTASGTVVLGLDLLVVVKVLQ